MTPLHQRMLEDMQLRGLAARTQESSPGAGVGGCISVWGAMRMAEPATSRHRLLVDQVVRSKVPGTGAAPSRRASTRP